MDLKIAVRKYRTLHKLARVSFAELVGISVNTVVNIEKGKMNTRKSTVKKLEDFLKDKMDEIRDVEILSDKSGCGPWKKGQKIELLTKREINTIKNSFVEKDLALGK